MTPERWERVKTLYDAARARPHQTRSAFLARECMGDTDLQLEVESLLDQPLGTDDFIKLIGGGPAAATIDAHVSGEIASLQGVCASGMMALKSAFLQVKSGEKKLAAACASEFPSRFFKASRYESHVPPGTSLPFDVEFLRWMLSDGAGAALLSPEPAPRGLSLRLDWLELTSFAHMFPVCMYAGAKKREHGELGPSWLDYPSFEAAAAEGTMYLRQDVRLLDRVVKLGVDGVLSLAQRGRFDRTAIDHVICHYSSHVF